MDAAGHQAITKYAEAEALAVPAEEFEVRTVIVINEENILLPRELGQNSLLCTGHPPRRS